MKNINLIIFFVIIRIAFSTAQVNLKLSGYIVDLPAVEFSALTADTNYSNNNTGFINLTRIRLNSSMIPWKNSRIETEYEVNAFLYNKSAETVYYKTEKTNRQLFRLIWTPVNKNKFILTHLIDRLYLRQNFSKGNFIIGRQRVAWGTGRVWNPTDLFNPVNPVSYFKTEKDGADAVSFKLAFGNFTDINAVFNPQENFENNNYGLRFRTNFTGYDLSVSGGYFDKRITGGLDFAGNLYSAGIRGEGIISVNKDSSNDKFIKFILGIDNQFTPELYALAEYLYNGEGKTNSQEYDFIRLLSGEIQNLSKNYLCIMAEYSFNPLLNFKMTDIFNFNDGSGLLGLVISYSAKENLNIDIGSQITFGHVGSEYRHYPVTVYSLCQFFF